MYHFGPCGESKQDPNIVCKDHKSRSKFYGLNKGRKTILKVRVDGCLKIESRRCDWLLIDTAAHIAYFIELKGCELKDALVQLGNTINSISNPEDKYIQQEFSKKRAYAILRRCPMDAARIGIERKKFWKKYKTDLTVKNKEIQVIL